MTTKKARPRLLKRVRSKLKSIRVWFKERRMPRHRQEARRRQELYIGTYVGVTGSVGKTTAALLTTRLLATQGKTLGSDGSNHGRQLVRHIARINKPVDYVVQEISGGKPGAINDATDALRIDVAIVTTIGYDHGSAFDVGPTEVPDAIAREKGKLVEAVQPGGLVCLNADDPRVLAMRERTGARVVTYGRSEQAEVRAINVEARWPGRLSFDLVVDGRTYPIRTRFVGTLLLPSVLASLAVIHGLGLPLERCIAELAQVEPAERHMSVHQTRDGRTVVLDTFKAPLWATALLLEDLKNIGADDLTFVLGEMSDIRNDSNRQYRRTLRAAAALCGQVVAVGPAYSAAKRVLATYPDISNLVAIDTVAEAGKYLKTLPPGLVLAKSNKRLELERIMDAL